CRMHKGDARFVRLQGVTNKTAFFRAIARALGLASSYMRKATDMQSRIEDMMQRSGLLLVLDESQYAFAQGERIYSRPELVDWIQTALCNHGVPVALIASPLFSKRLHQAERQTIWNSDQFKRRIYRYEVLPAKPTRNDIELVVKHHLPDGGSAEHKFLAGYAATASHPFTAIADTLADAAQLAETAGRARVSLKDLMEAVSTFRATSELAKRQAFDTPQGKQLRKRAEQPLKTHSSAFETELKPEGAEDNFTGRRPVAAHETHSPERNRTEHFQPD
ncbi:MAG TPA: ATP-binding protein, partial [Candidatus Limnocylindria bacterium]|nr:ATP-binding protein [Candidatus Limnocylindria bacterium]